MARKFLTPAQVEDEYGLNQGTLANWRWRRVGPAFHKVGGGPKVLYERDSLEAFLWSGSVETVDSVRWPKG